MSNSKKVNTANKTTNVLKISLFDEIISKLPKDFKEEIIQTDNYLKTMRPLRFKRIVDKKAKKVTYVASDYGVSYMFKISNDKLTHNFQWYIVYNGKAETWHRRADFMEETLVEIVKSDHELAMRIFNALKTCNGLDSCYGERCLARTVYVFEKQKRLTCHGSVELGMKRKDFCDAREFFCHLNKLVKEKINSKEPLPEKIILCQTKRFL
jgi:hypothetical protein